MREARKNHLIEHAGLAFYRADDGRIIMAMGDNPPGRNAVEEARSIGGFEPGALCACYFGHHRLQGMLREGVPNGGRLTRPHRFRIRSRALISGCCAATPLLDAVQNHNRSARSTRQRDVTVGRPEPAHFEQFRSWAISGRVENAHEAVAVDPQAEIPADIGLPICS